MDMDMQTRCDISRKIENRGEVTIEC